MATQKQTNHYSMSVADALQTLSSTPNGITQTEASSRLTHYGKNALPEQQTESPLKLFFGQFNNALIWLLVLATILSLILGEAIEAAAMASIILITAILGFVQEYHASKAMAALKKNQARTAIVIREGSATTIAAEDIVPGDLIVLQAGDIVAADCRLTSSSSLNIDESSLTGESVPSSKTTAKLPEKTPLADQENMAFCATTVTYGKGIGIVTATGAHTQIGAIAGSLKTHEDIDTPLQRKFTQLSRQIGVGAIILILAVLILGIAQGLKPSLMLLTALSLTVATIPSALPAIVTIGLALGARTLARHNMLVKKLPAAESLGSVTIICTDKTGTLTKNQMTVTAIHTNGKTLRATGTGYDPAGSIMDNRQRADPTSIQSLLCIGALCNNATLTTNENEWKAHGDPTEAALLTLARKGGIDETTLKKSMNFIEELPFDSDRKIMTVILEDPLKKKTLAYVKGAPESILSRCTSILTKGVKKPLTEQGRKKILEQNETFASEALRVLALAYREIHPTTKRTIAAVEKDLTFVGLVGMIDPPRDGVDQAIATCNKAGIEVMMITGDNAQTAKAVATSIGLYRKGKRVLTGDQISAMTDQELASQISTITIIARALPLHKLRIVQALQRNGHIVAMTGDGVNDAPALQKADMGIAMGITGTDVAKEVSKATLVDDNFVTIVNAIKEGRSIYDKIITSARYLLSCNVGEITTVFFALLAGLPVPLLPLQILLINILTDQVPALGLGFETPDTDVMERPPRDPRANPLSRFMIATIALFGIIMGIGSLAAFRMGSDPVHARTLAFTTLVMFQMFAVISSRSLYFSLAKLNPFSNLWLTGGVIASITLQIAVIYTPFLQRIFGTTALSPYDWTIIIGLSSMGFVLMEAGKAIHKFVEQQPQSATGP